MGSLGAEKLGVVAGVEEREEEELLSPPPEPETLLRSLGKGREGGREGEREGGREGGEGGREGGIYYLKCMHAGQTSC